MSSGGGLGRWTGTQPGESEPEVLGEVNEPVETDGITEDSGLEDFDSVDVGPVSDDRLAALYHGHDGRLKAIADHAGLAVETVRERLLDCELYRPGTAHDPMEDPECLQHYPPHAIGLEPLGCSQCGTGPIVEHPCPDCGYDPRGATDE